MTTEASTTLPRQVSGPPDTSVAPDGPVPAAISEPGSGRGPSSRREIAWNTAVVAVPVAVLTWLGYQRRWLGDDGLIFIRTVRQILAGNGPNYNIGERAEATTSTLWTWLLALAAWTSGYRISFLALAGTLTCTALGFALAIDGTRRLHRRLLGAGARTPLPFGALVVVALPPFWDFATSGLEVGLIILWLGLSWWLLTRLSPDTRFSRLTGLSLLLGLGELVRPDLLMASVVFAGTGWLLARPSRARTVALAAVAGAVPAAYEVFRMGYYGELVPNTAIAKEASKIDPHRGLVYLNDLASPYNLGVPCVLALLLCFAGLRARRRVSSTVILLSAGAVVTGFLLTAYVIAIGGDFMHGRMLLPGLFAALLPIMTVPARRTVVPLAALLAVWTVVCAVSLRLPYRDHGPRGIEDSRDVYVGWSRHAHPTDERTLYRGMLRVLPDLDKKLAQATSMPGPEMIYTRSTRSHKAFWNLGYPFHFAPLSYHVPVTTAVVYGAIGMPGALLPTDGMVIDIFGLAYPLAGHLRIDYRGRAGHDKLIPIEWILADFTPPGTPVTVKGASPAAVAAARHVLTCGPIAELQQSVRAPLTAGRFWKNFIGAFGRNELRIPNDPIKAEAEFCPKAS